MQRIQQPTDRTCGQTCIAMISGRPVDEVCKVINKRAGTRTHDLIKALLHYGYECGDRLIRITKQVTLPSMAIVKMKHPTENVTHWVVWARGRYFDPYFEGRLGALAHGWRKVSYLEVGIRCN